MSLRHKLIAAALIPVLVVVLVQIHLHSLQQQLKDAQDRVILTQQVEREAGAVTSNLLAAEVSLRDLVLAGSSSASSANFSEHVRQAVLGFQRLTVLVADDPRQSRRADSAAAAAGQRLRLLDTLRQDVVSHKIDNAAAVSRLVESSPSLIEARDRIADFAREESRLVAMQQQALAHSTSNVNNWLEVTALLRILSLLAIAFAIYRGQVARLHRLAAAARDYSKGIPFPRIAERCDEIGLLTSALIEATDQVLEQKVKLARQEEYLELALRSAQLGVWEFDLLAGVFSFEMEAVIMTSKEFFDTIHPEDRAMVSRKLSDHLDAKSSVYECEFRRQTAGGEWIWLRHVGRISRTTESGKPARVTGVHRDITARKHMERDLEATSRKLTAVLESAVGAAIVATDLDGRITLFNVGAERMLGYKADEVMGSSPRLFVDPEECARPGKDAPTLANFVDPRPATYLRKDGTRLHVTQVVNTLRDADGNTCGCLSVAVDVTPQAELEREFRAANAELQIQNRRAAEATAAKNRFLASMSHEIRTPMNGVLGLTELLLDTPLNAQQRRLLETLQSSGDVLLSLLNEILDFSKIEAGKLELENTSFALEPVVRSVFDLLASRGERKGLSVELAVEDQANRTVMGDPTRVKQVVSNLLSNAIKFTRSGFVRVNVRQLHDAGEEGTFEISVQDSGIGIPLEEQQRIFESFAQASSSTTREFGGTGLGLAIAKCLIEKMGGSLTVESQAGEGATFRVVLTLRYGAAISPRTARRHANRQFVVRGIRILVAEDEPTNQLLTRAILENAGFQVRIASNGEEAVKAANTGNFDLILMDARMPKLDGLAATKAIRDIPGKKGTTPIIALTAGAFAEDRECCFQAGMDDFLAKPFRGAELIAKCSAWGASRRLNPPHELSRNEPCFADLEAYPADFAQDLIRIFLETAPPRFAELLASIRDGDAQAARDSAHFLRGGLCGSVMPSLEKRLREIELKSRAGDEGFRDQNIDSLIELFTTACDSARKWLEEGSFAARA